MGKPMTPIEDRLWSRVVKDPETGCWNWTGPISSSGYGVIGKGGRHAGLYRTHRLAWLLLRGPIPDGMLLDHLCLNKRCCNPDHLRIVTPQINLRKERGWRKTCKFGHPLPPQPKELGARRAPCPICARRWASNSKTQRTKEVA